MGWPLWPKSPVVAEGFALARLAPSCRFLGRRDSERERPMNRPHRTPRIVLIYDSGLSYDMQVMAGVAAYLQENGNFNVFIEGDRLKEQRLPDLCSWEVDGIISNFDFPLVAEAVIDSGIPAVGFGSGCGWYSAKARSIPYIFTDNQAIAQMAVGYLLQRGFRRFAYCGYPHAPNNGWSDDREKGFAAAVTRNGFDIRSYCERYRTSHTWTDAQQALVVWLRSLQKPVAVMAANDYRGRQVLEACRVAGIRVPEEVAVIGVDNDELLCQLNSPQLTSIEQGTRKMGYQAMALLNRIIQGEELHQRLFKVQPRRHCEAPVYRFSNLRGHRGLSGDVLYRGPRVRQHQGGGCCKCRGYFPVGSGKPLCVRSGMHSPGVSSAGADGAGAASGNTNESSSEAGRRRDWIQIGAAHDNIVWQSFWPGSRRIPTN